VTSPTVECLRCGHPRELRPGRYRYEECGACPRCEYVGWAYASVAGERARRLFRELPLQRPPRLETG
jgi:hypothetical protein